MTSSVRPGVQQQVERPSTARRAPPKRDLGLRAPLATARTWRPSAASSVRMRSVSPSLVLRSDERAQRVRGHRPTAPRSSAVEDLDARRGPDARRARLEHRERRRRGRGCRRRPSRRCRGRPPRASTRTSSTLAPRGPKPVDVFTKSAPASTASCARRARSASGVEVAGLEDDLHEPGAVRGVAHRRRRPRAMSSTHERVLALEERRDVHDHVDLDGSRARRGARPPRPWSRSARSRAGSAHDGHTAVAVPGETLRRERHEERRDAQRREPGVAHAPPSTPPPRRSRRSASAASGRSSRRASSRVHRSTAPLRSRSAGSATASRRQSFFTLTLQVEAHLARRAAARGRARASVPMRLIISPPLPMMMPFWLVALDVDDGVDHGRVVLARRT